MNDLSKWVQACWLVAVTLSRTRMLDFSILYHKKLCSTNLIYKLQKGNAELINMLRKGKLLIKTYTKVYR